MRLLIKLPTRSRPQRAIATVQSFTQMADRPKDLRFVVSIDNDDPTMDQHVIEQLFAACRGEMRVAKGDSANKVAACNRDLEHEKFDILVLASDDMQPRTKGYDTIIAQEMMRHFPNLDGALHFNDGHVQEKLCTLPVMGYNLWAKFGYVYHPDYKSLWCVTGDSLVYMADQTLRPISQVCAGDQVVGTSELVKRGRRAGPRAKLSPATVTAAHSRIAETVRITLESGQTIVCTADHLWAFYGCTRRYLVGGKGAKGPSEMVFNYGPAKAGRKLVRVHAMPNNPPVGSERDRGWLAGMYDGEGSFPNIIQSATKNKRNCDEIERILSMLGLNFVKKSTTTDSRRFAKPGSILNAYYIVGGRDEYLKFMDWMRPQKNDTLQVRKRMFTARFGRPDRIVSIEPAGQRTVYCLTTSTGNFVVNGLLSHNCDNEHTVLLQRLGRLPYISRMVIEHNHPSFGRLKRDALLDHTESFYKEDEATYNRRHAMGFAFPEILLSICIPSLRKRHGQLQELLAELNRQINAHPQLQQIETHVIVDGGELKVGAKRNQLLDRVKGRFTVFIDDDDMIESCYIDEIMGAINKDASADCIGTWGSITTEGRDRRDWQISTDCKTYHEAGGVYYRTPNHITPVRSEHARAIRFPEIQCGEDYDYATRLMASGRLARETKTNQVPIYHYRYSPQNTATQRR